MSAGFENVDATAGLYAAATAIGIGIVCEVALAAWAYRKPGFISLRETVERDARRSAASSSSSSNPSSSSPSTNNNSNKQKKEERHLNSMRMQLLKEMGVVRVKQMVIGTLSLVVLMQAMPRLFGGVPLLRLPFEPFKMLRSAAHKGLKEEDAAVDVAGYMFIFMLVQAGVRPTIAKLVDGGPTRRMNELQVQYQTQAVDAQGGVAGAAAAAARGGGGGASRNNNNNNNNNNGLRRRR